jgi:hypothetical protein
MISIIISVITVTYLAIGIAYFGRKKLYSHTRDTISELGETGSALSRLVSLGLFLPVGFLLLIIAYQLRSSDAQGLALCLAAGYILAAFFPCDPGSPLSGSWKQSIHNLGGAIEYVGGIYFIFRLSQTGITLLLLPYQAIAGVVLICTILISVPGFSFRGIVQRIAEILLFACVVHQTMLNN